jgi:hypothetical protein
MIETNVSKPIHRILSDLTGEERFDLALQLATKDLVRLKLKEAEDLLANFEQRYKMKFVEFKRAWEKSKVADKHSYDIEKDYWEWEAAESDSKRLRQMLEQLP